NFFNPSDGIAQGELAALGGSGQRGKKKKKSKKGAKDKEILDQTAQAAQAAQAAAAAKSIPIQHYKFPVVPGASLRNKRFYDDQYTQSIAAKHFTYAVIWTFGAALDDQSKPKFSEFVMELIAVEIKTDTGLDPDEEQKIQKEEEEEAKREQERDCELEEEQKLNEEQQKEQGNTPNPSNATTPKFKLPYRVSDDFIKEDPLFDVVVNEQSGQWERWLIRVPTYKYDPQQPYEEVVVQTEDTVATTTMLDMLNNAKANIHVTGTTGTGKTIVVNDFLHIATVQEKSLFFQIKTSAQSSAKGIQEVLEGRLTHRRSNLIGPPVGKQGIVFIDDMNTPTSEVYFAQPPIELLRQCIDQKGIYDRKKLTFIHLTETVFVAACGPPGGGRHEVTRRLTRQFHTIGMPQVGAAAMTTIYSFIIVGFLS
ncbi:MAG: putative Dynein heavy chain, partial [Streblomastix strix]